MKKVCLIHPPHPDSTDDHLDPPYGLLLIATYLRKHGVEVSVVDLSGDDTAIPVADFYGITSYISTLGITKELADKCRLISPASAVVVGGAHPSAAPGDFSYADHVVVGEGEQAMLDIVNGSKARTIIGKPVPFLFPSFDLVDVHSYHRVIAGEKSLPYITSRGCPYKCAFCGLAGLHKLGGKVRFEDADSVLSHLIKIKDIYGINRVNFQDDVFTLDRKRLRKILSGVSKLGLRFRCMGRAGYDTEETYQMLADSGCEQIAWGIESGSQYILGLMNKDVRVIDNFKVIDWARKYGITSRAFFILGFPGETEKTLEDTKDFIEWADPDQVFASNFIPYPGTDVAEHLKDYGILNISKDLNQYYQVSKDGTGGLTIDTEWLSREDFRELELNFRLWLKGRPLRGGLQDYEKVESNTCLHRDRDLRV
jgi:anaerobic magnesium-protoporphyrin IX monomethyl ester cyclase